MSQETVQIFNLWLDAILLEKHLNCQKLAKRAGISHTVISKARHGKPPKWEACNALAIALNVHPIEVFMAAGLLPPQPGFDVEFERLTIIYSSLSTKKRRLLINLLQALIDSTSSEQEKD
jgi:transcriptional regulator with XRE-family HTH domain